MSSFEFAPQSRTCLVCGSEGLRKFKARAFDVSDLSYVSIVECKSCTFAWQYPLARTEEQSVQWYDAAYTDQGQTQSKYFDIDTKRSIATLEFEFIAGLPVDDKKLLDVGAGAGVFAEVAAENGWRVTALDPALDTERIKNNPRINPIRGSVEKIPSGELFTVVTLWDVIEHATTPIDLIADANRCLQEGGWLVIETGNYKSADRISGGMNHWMYQHDHRWYFSPESIERLLREAGFSEFVFSQKVLRPQWRGEAKYAGPSKSELLKSIIKDPPHLPTHLSTYSCLKRAKAWGMSGIGIFAVAARKQSKTH